MSETILAGKLNYGSFHRCKSAAESLQSAGFPCQILSLLPAEYDAYVAEALRYDPCLRHKGQVLFLKDKAYAGGEDEFLEMLKSRYSYDDAGTNSMVFMRMGKTAMREYCTKSRRTYCTMRIQQGAEVVGDLLFELFDDKCPASCKHFMSLIRGDGRYKYEGCTLHRVVEGAFVQGGDVVGGKGDGNPVEMGIPDESYAVKHDAAGILGFANKEGYRHSASTQFYVTFAPIPWLDSKKVAFGRVIEGMRTLKLIQKVNSMNERPVVSLTIAACSEWTPS